MPAATSRAPSPPTRNAGPDQLDRGLPRRHLRRLSRPATSVYTVRPRHTTAATSAASADRTRELPARASPSPRHATGTSSAHPLGYPELGRLHPARRCINWFPDLDIGTYTGQTQAAWAVTGNDNYVVLGGEFPTVNGVAQQGLVRFTGATAPRTRRGPVSAGSRSNPTLSSPAAGTVRLRWQANHDQDNVRLTYRVIRDGATAAPAYTVTQDSTFWKRPGMSYLDSGLVPGPELQVPDLRHGSLAATRSGPTPSAIIAATSTPACGYADAVLADGPGTFWRFNDAAGTHFGGLGRRRGPRAGCRRRGCAPTARSSAKRPAPEPSTAPPTASPSTTAFLRAPRRVYGRGWVRTSSTSGGKIIGFGNVASGTSRVTDRNVYMDDAGASTSVVWNGAVRTINSGAGFNDGQWHQVTASTLGGGGMFLYVDGARAAFRTDVTTRAGVRRVLAHRLRPRGHLAQPAGQRQPRGHRRSRALPCGPRPRAGPVAYASGRSLAVPATPPTAPSPPPSTS